MAGAGHVDPQEQLHVCIAQALHMLDLIEDQSSRAPARLARLQHLAGEGQIVPRMLYVDLLAEVPQVLMTSRPVAHQWSASPDLTRASSASASTSSVLDRLVATLEQTAKQLDWTPSPSRLPSESTPRGRDIASQQGRGEIHAVLEQGAQLISQLPIELALLLLETVHREALTSPLAALLYLHMLLAPTALQLQSASIEPLLGTAGPSDPFVVPQMRGSGTSPQPAVSSRPLHSQAGMRDELRQLLTDCRVGLRTLLAELIAASRPTHQAADGEKGPSRRHELDGDIKEVESMLSVLKQQGEEMFLMLPRELAEGLLDTIESVPSGDSPLTDTLRSHYADNDFTLPAIAHSRSTTVASGKQLAPKRSCKSPSQRPGNMKCSAGHKNERKHSHKVMSYRSELSDPSTVSVACRKRGARPSCDNRVPDLGVRLSKQFESLYMQTAVLREQLRYLDAANADPFKSGSRAWRLAKRLSPLRVSPGHQQGRSSPIKNASGRSPSLSLSPDLHQQQSPSQRGDHSPMAAETGRGLPRQGWHLKKETDLDLASFTKNPRALLAALTLQRRVRGMLARDRCRQLANAEKAANIMIRNYKKLQQSHINKMVNHVREKDSVTRALKKESDLAASVLSELERIEQDELEKQRNEEQNELEELKEAERSAMAELGEALYAQEVLDKEKSEMLVWQKRVDRAWELYKDILEELGLHGTLSAAMEEDDGWFKENHPEAFRARRKAKVVQDRFDKEKREYEEALADLIVERQEADAALKKSEKEQREWKEAYDKAQHEQALVAAYRIARTFTDPRVSIKERFRAVSATNGEADRKVVDISEGKQKRNQQRVTKFGVIHAPFKSYYAGEFTMIQEGVPELLEQAYDDAKDEDIDGLTPKTLIRAMANIGRRLNEFEATRLVQSFDTDGNGTIDIAEFKEGVSRMTGMELPHGIGVEVYYLADRANMNPHMASYEGEIFEDKRFGVGRYTSPKGYWYLGQWILGKREGRGIEGATVDGNSIPLAYVWCLNGKRRNFERFDPKNKTHVETLQRFGPKVDTARKRAAKALRCMSKAGDYTAMLMSPLFSSSWTQHEDKPPVLDKEK